MTIGVYFVVAVVSVFLLGHFIYVMGVEAGVRECLNLRTAEALRCAAWALRWRWAAKEYRAAYLSTDQARYEL